MTKIKGNLFESITMILSGIIVFFVIIFVFFQWQIVKDYFVGLNYKPTNEIEKITENIGLTDSSRMIFYATQPEIQTSEQFNENCTSKLEKTAILGCYKNDRVYIYDITDENLAGVKEATSAHEMLHAAWARLDNSEKNSLKIELNAEYERIKTPDLEKTMAGYAETEPGEHENELHSIFATEFMDLSEKLEKYYSKIFKKRAKVVQYYEKYYSKFDDLKKKSEEIAQEMSRLKTGIEQESANYSEDLAEANLEIEQFNRRANSNYYESESTFYFDRNRINSIIAQLGSRRRLINSEVEKYNNLRAEAESISIQTQNLNSKLNSQLQTPADI